MKKLYTINTVNNFMDLIFKPFGQPFAEANPAISVFNIMDDSLLKDTLAAGRVTPVIINRILHYAQSAENSGANGIIVTCTSINEATKLIAPLLRIPIINIEEPVAEAVVENGTRIGVLATLPTSPAAIGRVINEKAQKLHKKIEIINSVVDGAFDVLCTGNRAQHDEMVCAQLYKLAKEVDVIACAQISMSLLHHEEVSVPLFKIGTSGFDAIKKLMNA